MTSRTASALRKSTAPRKTNSRKASSSSSRVDKLPEWNLSDLYSAIDAPEVTRDLDRLDAECVAFENDYKGRLAERTAVEGGGRWLAGAVKRYEASHFLSILELQTPSHETGSAMRRQRARTKSFIDGCLEF